MTLWHLGWSLGRGRGEGGGERGEEGEREGRNRYDMDGCTMIKLPVLKL